MIFRRRRERRQAAQDHLEKAKAAQRRAAEQMREAQQLIERSHQVAEESARIRDENHFIETYLAIFRGEVPPKQQGT